VDPVPGGYKYGNLALQVGGVSDETVKYGYGICVTQTIELREDPKLQIANCRPILSSERAPHRDKAATFRQEVISGHKSQGGLDTKTYN
jgi:hypothetical protein